MREYKHVNGGSPIYTDDLLWINDNFRLFTDASKGAVAESYQLTDVNFRVSGSDHVVDAGWIVLSGQVCRVLSATVEKFNTGVSEATEASNGYGTYFEIEDQVDVNGNRTLLAGGTAEPWVIRTAVLKSSDSPGAYTQGVDGWHFSTVVTLDEAFADLVKDKVKAYIKATASNTNVTSLINGWALGANYHLYIQKDLYGWVRMSGMINGVSASDVHFYTLPVGLRPFINGVVGAGAYTSSGSTGGHVRIDPGGQMKAHATGNDLAFCLTYYTGE